jgi:transposase
MGEKKSMAYSIDFRKKILDAYLNDEGTNQEIADRFKISISTVKRIGQRFRETGKIELYLKNIGHTSKVDENAREVLKKLIGTNSDVTREEICRHLLEECQIRVTPQAIHYILKSLALTYKKKSIYASQRDREDVKKKRRIY